MTRHVDLLALFYLLWGALSLVAGTAILVLALGALAIITSPGRAALGPDLGANFTAGVFFVFAAASLAWGGLQLGTGRSLAKRRPRARLVGLGLAVLNLFFLPLGTALAVYTFWVLLADETRRMFEPGMPSPGPGSVPADS